MPALNAFAALGETSELFARLADRPSARFEIRLARLFQPASATTAPCYSMTTTAAFDRPGRIELTCSTMGLRPTWPTPHRPTCGQCTARKENAAVISPSRV